MARQAGDVDARFWSKVDKGENCWMWRGSAYRGYGRFAVTPKTHVMAHRWSFVRAGGSIPPGWFVHHLCGQKLCVRPSHLEAITKGESMARGKKVEWPADSIRFWQKVDRSGECWLWTGAKGPLGYGTAWADRRYVRAHRFSYEEEYGSIPEGLVLDHLCSNPSCVRPSHLEAVTQAENLRRGRERKQCRAS